jgi:hypothetical protein
MAEFFPRESIVWRLHEPSVLRRLSVALVPYALAVGVALRVFRWAMLAFVQPSAALAFLATTMLGVLLLGALSAGHLANFPLSTWRWRAPAFALVVVVGESLASLALTVLGQERVGRASATLADWLPTTLGLVWSRLLIVAAFAAVLAVIVTLMRRTLDESSAP